MTVMLMIGDREFHLAENEDTNRLEGDALSAARAGGGFVHFVVQGGRHMTALVTAHLSVVFADSPVALPILNETDIGLSFVDFDAW